MDISLTEKLQALPAAPGVYLMKDARGNVIYVGKSKNLKNRVRSYFQNSKAHPPKTKKLVRHLKDFELILTDTEFEAFMLECRLIKELQPLYNRKMKSPRSYTYITVALTGELRGIEITGSRAEQDGRLCFGPYTSSRSTVERAVQGLKDCLKINCSRPSATKSPCLNHSLGLCIGMCLGGDAMERYNQILNRIMAMLAGADTGILEELKQRMLEASERYDFEAAAKYRDTVDAVNALVNKEKVIEFAEGNRNIAVIEELEDHVAKLFLIKGSSVLFSETYIAEDTSMDQLRQEIRFHIVDRFALNVDPLPVEIGKHEIDEAQIIYSYLTGSSCRYIIIPEEWLDPEECCTMLDEAIARLLSSQTNIMEGCYR